MTGKFLTAINIPDVPKLTKPQIVALRNAPLGRLPNKLSIAFAFSGEKQTDACESTGLSASDMSKLVRGAYQSLDVDKARRVAAYFGCSIEDLFPARQEVA